MTFAGRRVLLVEDEFLAALTTIDLLESIGCEVVGPAARLALAVQLAQSESLDAAVLDINLAGELVWPVAEALQRRRVPFLFLSAYSQSAMIPRHLAGAPLLAKPLEKGRFLRHLSAIWAEDSGFPAAA
jgi:CheY-like chemotaxis protein